MRLVVSGCCFSLLALGTVAGSDDHFPFGPFRMFANASKPDGAISVPVLRAELANGRDVPLDASLLGLRRAELEGRLSWFTAEPSRLGLFADQWAARHPDEPPVVAVHLERRRQQLRNRMPVGEPTVVPVASWEPE